MRALLLLLSLGLAGCATNGISVSETTAAGDVLEVKQKTLSSWGAKTQEGAGNFVYTATAPDGSSFDMRAGAAVTGQEANDPTAALLGVVQMLAPVMSEKIAADAAAPPRPREPGITAAQVEAIITRLLEARE